MLKKALWHGGIHIHFAYMHVVRRTTHNFSLYLKFNFISKILSRRISISLCECVNTRKLFPGDESQIRKEKKKKKRDGE